jgi:hypothetical protein
VLHPEYAAQSKVYFVRVFNIVIAQESSKTGKFPAFLLSSELPNKSEKQE